jgi:peptide/nickel transport system permease protein
VRRLLGRYLLLAAAVVVLNFLLPRLLPGDPLDIDAPGGLNSAVPALTAEARFHLRTFYHLDQPVFPDQFLAYLADLAHGELGWSMSKSAPVSALIAERLPWTLALVLTAVLVAATGGTALGLLAGWRGGRIDRMVVDIAAGLSALPEFLVALGLLLLLAVGPGWFPLQGGRSSFAAVATGPGASLGTTADIVWHLTLPGLTLVVSSTAGFVLLARGSIRAIVAEPYLATARAKGLTERRVALEHALPNALLPVLTLLGVRAGHVFSGALGGVIVVERVFSVPGLGLLAFEAIRARDYPVLQATFLLGSAAMLLASLAAELAYRRLEPRGAT